MAVMDRNNYYNKETCLICADAAKCFDKLWLEDCLSGHGKAWTEGTEDTAYI